MNAYHDTSFWFDRLPAPLTPRPALHGSSTCDVAIIGGGYTGLWTAYYLKRACPALDYKFVVLTHNTIRGAAGAAVLNAELMHSEGMLD
jgi:glycine/D-amino acid oxidase-like deaminating enzyme